MDPTPADNEEEEEIKEDNNLNDNDNDNDEDTQEDVDFVVDLFDPLSQFPFISFLLHILIRIFCRLLLPTSLSFEVNISCLLLSTPPFRLILQFLQVAQTILSNLINFTTFSPWQHGEVLLTELLPLLSKLLVMLKLFGF